MKIPKNDQPLFFVLLFLGVISIPNAFSHLYNNTLHAQDAGFLGVSSDGWVAIFTFILAGSTIGLWFATWRAVVHARTDSERQARDMQASLAAAETANKIAASAAKVAQEAFQETIASTDRAWIKIDAEITGALVFTAEEISTKVRITFTNVGKSPATHVQPIYYPMFADVGVAAFKADDSIRDKIIFSKYGDFLGLGRVLFPNEHFSVEYEYEMSVSDFKTRIAEIPTDQPEPWTTGHPAILACVRYILAGDTKNRYIFVPFEISRHDLSHPGFDGGETRIDPGFLDLRQMVMSGRLN